MGTYKSHFKKRCAREGCPNFVSQSRMDYCDKCRKERNKHLDPTKEEGKE